MILNRNKLRELGFSIVDTKNGTFCRNEKRDLSINFVGTQIVIKAQSMQCVMKHSRYLDGDFLREFLKVAHVIPFKELAPEVEVIETKIHCW